MEEGSTERTIQALDAREEMENNPLTEGKRKAKRSAARQATDAEAPGLTIAPVETGMHFSRYFSDPRVSPYEQVAWETRSAVITNEHGKVVFEQKECEI